MFEEWAGSVLRKVVAGVTHNDPVGIALGVLLCFAGSLLTTVGSLLTIKGARLGGRASLGLLRLGWRGARYCFKGRPLSPLAKAIWDAFDRFDPLPGPDWLSLSFGERVNVEFTGLSGPVIKVWGRDVRDHVGDKEYKKLVARARVVCARLISQERAAVAKDLEAIVLHGADDDGYGLTRDPGSFDQVGAGGPDVSFEIDENGNTKTAASPPPCNWNKCKDDRKDGCSM